MEKCVDWGEVVTVTFPLYSPTSLCTSVRPMPRPNERSFSFVVTFGLKIFGRIDCGISGPLFCILMMMELFWVVRVILICGSVIG